MGVHDGGQRPRQHRQSLQRLRVGVRVGLARAQAFDAVIDGYFLTEPPAVTFGSGKAAHVPLLVGSNSQEGPAEGILGRAAPTVACSAPIPLADEGWQADVTFKDGKAVLFAKSGTPPDDAIGTKPLVFQ